MLKKNTIEEELQKLTNELDKLSAENDKYVLNLQINIKAEIWNQAKKEKKNPLKQQELKVF